MNAAFADEIRIPTLLGLGILISGLVIGGFLVNQRQTLLTKAAPTVEPKNITVANLSSLAVSIYWQTDIATTGFVQAGVNPSLGQTFLDERDLKSPSQYNLHFVTLNNLNPNTTYYYKVTSGPANYPKGSPLTFKTPLQLPSSGDRPLIGKVVDERLQPIQEAIIKLEIPGAQILAAITKTAGNFIIPLSELRTDDNKEVFKLSEASPAAQLTIINTSKSSEVKFKLPFSDILPPIVLGKNLDLIQKVASPAAAKINFDLNKDGVVNSHDYSVVVQNLGNKPKVKETDLNGDGIVDKKDLDLINQQISTSR